MEIYRTKFKGEIISEFSVPAKKSNKVMILCSGMPSVPKKQDVMEFFAKRGYWVFLPRYRGSWESEGVMFKYSPTKDIRDIISELPKGFKEFWGNKNFKIGNPKVYLIGSSFGGPAALLNSKLKEVKKVICFSPVIDWQDQKNTTESIERLAPFLKKAFGRAYVIAKDGWKKIKQGKLYNPSTETEKVDGSKCLIFHAKDDDIVLWKPLKPFIGKTGAKLMLAKIGGHLGMAILEKRFYKKCMQFLAGRSR
ncbi:MAG TPA: alpha/beta hydrolase [Candidatus Paceibacterota bacterium]